MIYTSLSVRKVSLEMANITISNQCADKLEIGFTNNGLIAYSTDGMNYSPDYIVFSLHNGDRLSGKGLQGKARTIAKELRSLDDVEFDSEIVEIDVDTTEPTYTWRRDKAPKLRFSGYLHHDVCVNHTHGYVTASIYETSSHWICAVELDSKFGNIDSWIDATYCKTLADIHKFFKGYNTFSSAIEYLNYPEKELGTN